MKRKLIASTAALLMMTLASCSGTPSNDKGAGENSPPSANIDDDRGPNGGHMLRNGDFALEITIFEDGVEPEYRIYAYRDDKAISPSDVKLALELRRLGGKVDRFAFRAEQGYLRGDGVVTEPHSFDVMVHAVEGGRKHVWRYPSYEGRTTISAEAAKAGGVKTEKAGGANIAELVDMGGRVEITPEGRAEVRARLPGPILSMSGRLGDQVSKGQILLRVESSHSLQSYNITAPISGTIIEKNGNVGDVTGDRALFVVADPSNLHAEFFIFPRDAERIRVGQRVTVRSLSGDTQIEAPVEAILPAADIASQTMVAHVHLPPSAARKMRPGMGVEGAFAVSEARVPLAVRTQAIQRFRDFEVVYAKVGDTYEVRILTIGRRTPEWTEVLGGLDAGTEYVTDGAFLIRADIEKSGASHDH